MNKLATSSPDFSPHGCPSRPSGHSSRDDAPFLPWPPLPLPLAFGSGVLGGWAVLGLPGCLLATVLHRMTVCTAPETVTVKLLGFRLLVLPFSALLASIGLGNGVDIHGCRPYSMYIRLQKLLDRQCLFLKGVIDEACTGR